MVSFYASWAHLSEETQESFLFPLIMGHRKALGMTWYCRARHGMWCRHLRRGHWRRTWSLVMWHLFPLCRGEWRDSGWRSTHGFCGLIWSHPNIMSSSFVPSSCKVMSISTSHKNIPFLTSLIQLRFSWFHLTHQWFFFLSPKKKPKQGSLGAYTGREEME